MPTTDDFAKIEDSNAKEKKYFVGKVTHYFDKIGVAAVKLVSDLKIGDEIVVIGKTTGIVKSKIDSIEIKKEKIDVAKKGNEVGIKIPKVRKNDEVYVLKQNKNN
jgi:putative protease